MTDLFYYVLTGPNAGKIGKKICFVDGGLTLEFTDGKFAYYHPEHLIAVQHTTRRSDRRKNPAPVAYRVLTNDEAAGLAGHAHCLDQYGKIGEVKITSVKTWKTRPGYADVHWKYGMYEYGIESVRPGNPQTFFIELVEV